MKEPQKPLQRRESSPAAAQRKDDGNARSVNTTGLPDNLRAGIENLSGMDMGDTKVHYNSARPPSMQAHANAQGTDIHVAPGKEKHLPHEAWHVVQQKQGRVRPTLQPKTGTPVNDDTGLEKEADVMGAKATVTQNRAVHAATPYSPGQAVLQGYFVDENESPALDSVVEEVKRYVRENVSEWLESFKNEQQGEDPQKLNDWTVENLGLNVMQIQALGKDKDKKVKKKQPQGLFTFTPSDRRIKTGHQGEGYKETQFYKLLNKSDQKPDLSYKDLRLIMDAVLLQYPYLTIEDINKAIEAGVNNFDKSNKNVTLVGDVNVDLQLVAHHLLRYQSFNRAQLQEIPKNLEENKYRALEMEKSKRMLLSSGNRKQLDRLVPSTPNQKKGKGLGDAMPGLIDLNRPLENSIFDGGTYKAVFVLAHKLFRSSFDKASESLGTEKKHDTDTQIDEQRKFFNPSFFELVPNMDNSSVKKKGGKSYITQELGFNYDSDNESFDEGSNESSDEDTELSDNEKIYDSDDNIFEAEKKRKTFLNTMGLFSKMEGQKEMLDGPDGTEKHQKIRRKINRRSMKATRKYNELFKEITGELGFYNGKTKDISKKKERVKNELDILVILRQDRLETGDSRILRSISDIDGNEISQKVINFNKKTKGVRGNSKDYREKFEKMKDSISTGKLKQRWTYLKEAQIRLEDLEDELVDFYEEQSMGDIAKERNKPDNSTWRKRKAPGVFPKLGPKTLDKYVFPPVKKKKKESKKRALDNKKDKSPRKKRRL